MRRYEWHFKGTECPQSVSGKLLQPSAKPGQTMETIAAFDHQARLIQAGANEPQVIWIRPETRRQTPKGTGGGAARMASTAGKPGTNPRERFQLRHCFTPEMGFPRW